MQLRSIFQRLRRARESIFRCLWFAALKPWTLIRPASARRKGGVVSITTELAERRLVLSASPLSSAFDETGTFPEIDADSVTRDLLSSEGYEVFDDLWIDLPQQELPSFFTGVDLLVPEWPSASPEDDATTTGASDGVTETPGNVSVSPDNGLIDFDNAIDGDVEQISDGLEPSDLEDVLFPIDDVEEGGLHIADSLQAMLSQLLEDLEFADSLIARAESGEFVSVFPVFSEETGGATLDTFPNQTAPLEVLISVAPANPLDAALSTAENTVELYFDDLGDWVSGSLEEKSYQLELAIVNAISAVLPEVPFVLSSSIGGAGVGEFIVRRFVVVDGFGYPMQRRLREGGPVLTGDDEPILDDPNFGGGPVLGEESQKPEPVPGATGSDPDTPHQEPHSAADAGLTSSNVFIHQDQSINLRGTVAPNGIVVQANESESWNPNRWTQGKFAPWLPSHETFATSYKAVVSADSRMKFAEWAGFHAAWTSREVAFVQPEFIKSQRSVVLQTDAGQFSSNNSPGHQQAHIGAEFSSPGVLVQSPVTTELATSVLPSRLQLIPLSAQVQIRRYRTGHRQATAAEYAEIPLRSVEAVSQERLENNAPSQLRYVLNPRAPPRGPPSSECLIETFAENDLLERLRYSIAPRGPSLADSSSLSPGSVFFSGPRVSPVSLAS